ncbi:hypothetical protein ACHQM5_029258 [Ranunculus cassubicifolius]
MGSLVEKTLTKEPGWRPNAFIIDDPTFEITVIRDAFRCRVLLCLRYIRRAWVRNLIRNCCNFDVQLEMFKHLGRILYYAKSEPSTLEAIVEFSEIFIDQTTFMDYFKDKWLPRIETWVHAMRTLPVANLEIDAAIESYHLRLTSKLFDEIHSGSWHRVDWLTLTTEFHALYWFDFYSEETGYFNNMRGGIPNSWHRALLIPDIDVIFDDQELRFVKVVSQSNRSLVHTVWNPGSEFSLCDCSWSRLGNLCKHVTKVGILCRIRQLARPSFAAQMYHQTLLSLLQNPPDDPVILDHAILHATRLQQDIKGEDLSNSGLLQGLAPVQTGVQVADGLMNLPHFS